MEATPPPPATVCRRRVVVRGVVQGVGFRPFVYNAATARGLSGWVQNEADTVRLEIEGETARVVAFLDALRHEHPPQGRIDSVAVNELPPHAAHENGAAAGQFRHSRQCRRGRAAAHHPGRSGHLRGLPGRDPR